MVRGGGEMASAAARLLFLAGFRVVVLERDEPLAVRRLVSFSEAVRAGEATVEGVRAVRTEAAAVAPSADVILVAVDPEANCLQRLSPSVLLDGRMLKTAGGTTRDQAPLVIGLGPGFVAGADVDAVVETQRGPDLGRVAWSGTAEPDSARPAPVLGYTHERLIRAPRAGRFRAIAGIGDLVPADALIGHVDGEPVRATIAGLLRGLVADGVTVPAGAKLGDIDPRGPGVQAGRISDKARTVAAGVLEAVLIGLKRKSENHHRQ